MIEGDFAAEKRESDRHDNKAVPIDNEFRYGPNTRRATAKSGIVPRHIISYRYHGQT